jgi:hypothetical protein
LVTRRSGLVPACFSLWRPLVRSCGGFPRGPARPVLRFRARAFWRQQIATESFLVLAVRPCSRSFPFSVCCFQLEHILFVCLVSFLICSGFLQVVASLVPEPSNQRLNFSSFLSCSRGCISDTLIRCSMKYLRGYEKFIGPILVHHSFTLFSMHLVVLPF